MVDRTELLPVTRQCELLGLPHPYYGNRRIRD